MKAVVRAGAHRRSLLGGSESAAPSALALAFTRLREPTRSALVHRTPYRHGGGRLDVAVGCESPRIGSTAISRCGARWLGGHCLARLLTATATVDKHLSRAAGPARGGPPAGGLGELGSDARRHVVLTLARCARVNRHPVDERELAARSPTTAGDALRSLARGRNLLCGRRQVWRSRATAATAATAFLSCPPLSRTSAAALIGWLDHGPSSHDCGERRWPSAGSALDGRSIADVGVLEGTLQGRSARDGRSAPMDR